jgi:phosphate transport system substrate-binding protein
LSAVDPYFKGFIGANKAPTWPTKPLKGKGNPGVAALVKQTPGTIGYVEYAYAKQANLPTAVVQNKKGEFVAPSLESANQALATVKFPENFRVFEGDPAEGYPITGLTWMMVYKEYKDSAKSDAVKKWIQWVLTDGQQLNDELDYTRIPADVAQRALQVVEGGVKP